MRLLVPRRGRGGSLRRLTRRLVAAAVVVAALTGCGGSEPKPKPTPTPTATATPPPERFSVGITEPNPAFLVGSDNPAFNRWRDVIASMKPRYYRLVIDWAGVASPDGAQLDLAKPQGGCMRDIPPCAGWNGVRAQLQALAKAQKAMPGRLLGMVVFTGTPAGVAAPPSGCERTDTQPRSRPPRGDQLGRYRQVVQAVYDEARRAGANVPYWSPWNEPNHPYFLSPQRARCTSTAETVSAQPYAQIADAMLQVLDRAPGDQKLVLGETAGLFERKSTTTTAPEFIRHLPKNLVCRAAVYGEHGYLSNENPVGRVHRALKSFGCPGGVPPIWITETGTKDPDACSAMRRRLDGWRDDPRVGAAFQYTVREDDRFPTGLVTTDLERALPALKAWTATC